MMENIEWWKKKTAKLSDCDQENVSRVRRSKSGAKRTPKMAMLYTACEGNRHRADGD
jgi:hypothetical protein